MRISGSITADNKVIYNYTEEAQSIQDNQSLLDSITKLRDEALSVVVELAKNEKPAVNNKRSNKNNQDEDEVDDDGNENGEDDDVDDEPQTKKTKNSV
ncbi:hypothetical protein AKO1_009568 [Acrasis kona]|uniref:EKC/KEOPS complex subunit GON7 n=1 Tax=Acrasis kona TaxID=1008807 RepID=A0AAW2ZN45_9EUKA